MDQPPAVPPPSPSWSLGCEGSLGRGLAAPPALHPRLPQREDRPSHGASGSGGQGPPALPSSGEAPQQQDVNGGEGRWAKLAVTHPCRGAPGTGTERVASASRNLTLTRVPRPTSTRTSQGRVPGSGGRGPGPATQQAVSKHRPGGLLSTEREHRHGKRGLLGLTSVQPACRPVERSHGQWWVSSVTCVVIC